MMLPDKNSQPAREPAPAPEIDPISPEDASVIMERALEPYTADGWQVLSKSAYDAHLTRGMRNLDVRVDLLGQVETNETGLTPLQDSGRLTAWVLLLASLLLVLTVASVLGII